MAKVVGAIAAGHSYRALAMAIRPAPTGEHR